MMKKPKVAAIVLTRNEEQDLPACLQSLNGLVSEVYVIDSGSTDRTVEIARSFGANVLFHEFSNHAAQINWAIQEIQSHAEWLFRIDADERVSVKLAKSLLRLLPTLSRDVTGIEIPRRIRFLGRNLRWGDTYPVWLLRLWRNGCARCEQSWMDEHMVLLRGQAIRTSGDLIHEIPKSLSEWTRKHDWYADRECLDILGANPHRENLVGQARLKRILKQRIYLRTPRFLRVLFYWFYRYVFRLGFLDGQEGMIYHMLQGMWYRFLVDAKLLEMEKKSTSGPMA